TPRSSQVDVVQSVGRVMRLSPGKQQGYVILPVVIPAGVEPKEALDNNETYRVVWHVLNALRAHDDRFDAMINKLEFNGSMPSKMEVIAIADSVKPKARKQTPKQRAAGKARNGSAIGSPGTTIPTQEVIGIEIGEIERALCAKIVKKCGNRHHWEDWANDIAKIANTHIDRIKAILEDEANTAEIAAFQSFAKELRDDLNNSISDDEIIEMLAQHLITKPVFDALFEQYRFAEHNPMSQAMQQVLDQLQEHHLDKERNTLEDFYASVKMRANDINSAEGKQRIVVELYDKFFRNAFPRMTERLGIVYTPVEVVDFILHSVEHVLKTEFNSSMADENVHILDPFTGTGTFITRLLQSGIIPEEKLPYKYQHEIHANEIVLLAYYIAAINIEATYHGILTGNIHGEQDDDASVAKPAIEYQSFKGICLTDTFQMAEKEDRLDKLLEKNSHRRKHQQKLNIRVIVGNPPYSAGQKAANDNNANVAYPKLDDHIRSTYIVRSAATLKNALYDSYIRAIRWSSNRIGNCGVIGFVTNAGFIEANAADGLRQCLAEEFSNLYIFHLRGNARTSGERRRKEKDNVFGQGTRTPIAISILVKNSESKKQGRIYFYDIGDYLTREQKLKTIVDFGSIEGITKQKGWQEIEPDQFGDWLNQRDPNFDTYISLGNKKDKTAQVIFENYSNGVKTNRDAWVYNASLGDLSNTTEGMVAYYNKSVEAYKNLCQSVVKENWLNVDNFLDFSTKTISWTLELKQDLARHNFRTYSSEGLRQALYRPFTKSWIFFDKYFNNSVYQIPRIFPTKDSENLMIYISGTGNSGKDFSVLITDVIPDLNMQHSGGQGFPLYLYEKIIPNTSLFSQESKSEEYQRRDAITDEALAYFQSAYPQARISKEDIFYYIYGLLHSEDYRERYADNLSKQLPRIPCVKTAANFWAFSQAGCDLAYLHLNYETVPLYTGAHLSGSLKYLKVTEQKVLGGEDADFYVTSMKFGKTRDPETGRNVDDKTTVIYNTNIVIENIPEEAYDYEVNGKPALEWVMERQGVKTDKASGITNDANDWAIETMDNARYPLELFLRVITVSLKSQAIVNGLPKLTTQAVALDQSSLLQEKRFATGR
ncbi:MAG: damage-inducible protein, partial [Nitrosomonas sp. PRO5]|nr:damage-inducible protein [Nitrosomonas sp. PRO5]